ncbi:MAG: hypothetical protein A3G44_10215 [Candidatus Rokubacteria bacterium RIFCSPLOWO2_12_FULL_73_47]|nr:MAG: hypothetical protein A3G44_10215 [Candidatus Rokubacteria bacterium RIFCSPLOWO2_12_FULL_73_47]
MPVRPPLRRRALALAATLLLGGCAAVETKPIAGAAPPAPRPAYAVGQRWIRSDGVWDLRYAGADVYAFRAADGSEIILNRDLLPRTVVDRSGGAGAGLNEPFQFFPTPRLDWPLAVGKHGASRGKWQYHREEVAELPSSRVGGGTYRRVFRFVVSAEATFTWRVDAWEQVRIPAGRFEAYRLTFRIVPDAAEAQGAPAWWLRAWYAPAVRQFVAAEGANVGLLAFKLVAVDPVAAEPLQVLVRDPADGLRVSRRDAALSGRVTAGKGIARVAVSVNGREVWRRAEADATVEAMLEARLALDEGRNVVIVTATDTAGETRQEARTVFYDASAARRSAEAARAETRAAREAATRAEASRLAAEPWGTAAVAEQAGEAARAAGDVARAEERFVEARGHYERAAMAAAWAAALARARSENQARAARVAGARRAAEQAAAPRWAPEAWRRAGELQGTADSAAGRDEHEQVAELLLAAEAAYRRAESEALARATAAAAAERERLDAIARQRQAAERQAAAAAAARADAERAAAPRHLAAAFAGARGLEDEGRAALGRSDWAAAQERLRGAESAFREAAAAARREGERLAGLEWERAAAVRASADAARERAMAEQADAGRLAGARLEGAARRARAAEAAERAQDYGRAAALWREAGEAYRQATAEAKAAARQPVRVVLTAPAEQAVVEQETLSLTGTISAPRGLQRVLVTLNGREVSRRDTAASGSLPLAVAVRLREGQNTLVVTVTDTDGTITQQVRSVQFERPTPLTVAVRYPENGATLASPSSVVAAVVSSSRGIARVSVTLNGEEVHAQVERRPQRSVAVAVPLSLRPGSNVIVLSATEPGGRTQADTRTVVFTPPAAAGTQAAAAPAAGEAEHWAVVVGVGAYDSPDIPKLRYTVEDAEAVARTLVEHGGFKPQNVLLLTDRTDARPTLRRLKWALGTFLARSAKKGDTVLIFFAGHGAPEVDVAGRERDGLAKYLVPMDADADDLYATALPMDEFETIFGRIEAERIVVFLDACYSGAAGGRTFASRKTRALNLDDQFLERLAQARGRAIVTASRAGEVSVELSELGHGLFTYYLVEGLRGAADRDRDAIVTLQELYQYVEQQVSRHSRAVGANQHPVMKGELEGLLPLVRVRK